MRKGLLRQYAWWSVATCGLLALALSWGAWVVYADETPPTTSTTTTPSPPPPPPPPSK